MTRDIHNFAFIQKLISFQYFGQAELAMIPHIIENIKKTVLCFIKISEIWTIFWKNLQKVSFDDYFYNCNLERNIVVNDI